MEKTIFTPVTDTTYTSGIPGVRANQPNSTVDDVEVIGNVYDVSSYRGTESYTYPTPTGLVFAGWYTDADFTTPLGTDVKEGTAYAKFVDSNVLTILNQLPLDVSANAPTTNLRILTSIDCDKYTQVGFTVAIGDWYRDLRDGTDAYETITAYEGNFGAIKDASTEFNNTDSKYFVAAIVTGTQKDVFTIADVIEELTGTQQ